MNSDDLDVNRVRVFRQLKKEIRGSKDYLIVGIDIAKDKHNAFFGTAQGKTLWRRLVFDNSIEGFNKLRNQVEALKVEHDLKKVVFGMEPTANYHKPLGEHLIGWGEEVVLVSGNAVKHNRQLMDGRWDKHDTKDSANVADLISQGKCLYYDYPLIVLRDLRALLAFKRRLKKEEHSYKVRIRNNLLAKHFPEMDFYYKDTLEGLAIVRWSPDPRKIAGMGYEAFCRLVAPGKRAARKDSRLQAIWTKAHDSIGCEAGETFGLEAELMVSGLKEVRKTIKAVEAKNHEVCSRFSEYKYLLSIPGFGPDVASKVLGAIGNPFRFANGKQVLKMAGLDLSANRSGKTSNVATPVISKRGKADLRYALYQAALIASTRNKDFIDYYTNHLRGREREKGIKTKMRVKLAAKMLVMAWTLMKKRELFNPGYLTIK
ncbi:MAG: IS110 family transposase [Methanosarcinales archaeon]|nr:MAG: IS110 family transposase [Methanosarcinales archaeon]